VENPFFSSRQMLQFGHRRMAPRVCVVDTKPHIRTFLSEVLEDLGFVVSQCDRASTVVTALRSTVPDLIVLGLLAPESDVTKVLRSLASEGYSGKVMLFGGRASPVLLALHDLGENLRLAMLPPLRTPFRDSDLQDSLSIFLPIPESPSLPVDVDESLRNGWLDLWYQPKIDLKQMSVSTAEAVVRVRHPAWGVVPPAAFIPSDEDPSLQGLSDFVVGRAISDWTHFVKGKALVELAVPLPLSALVEPDFVDKLFLRLPDHAALAKLTVEISSADASYDPALVRKVAKQLESYNVAISIDDVMAQTSWVGFGDFPIAELQIDSNLINGCAGDRHKRTVCGMVLGIAERLGARTLAKGIEAPLDFKAVCGMGFDLGQGALFGKPMEARKFARTMLRT
jgi:EAL domain-containing protein (putative c-di-GMP-specific phosphodiesterase class I)